MMCLSISKYGTPQNGLAIWSKMGISISHVASINLDTLFIRLLFNFLFLTCPFPSRRNVAVRIHTRVCEWHDDGRVRVFQIRWFFWKKTIILQWNSDRYGPIQFLKGNLDSMALRNWHEKRTIRQSVPPIVPTNWFKRNFQVINQLKKQKENEKQCLFNPRIKMNCTLIEGSLGIYFYDFLEFCKAIIVYTI